MIIQEWGKKLLWILDFGLGILDKDCGFQIVDLVWRNSHLPNSNIQNLYLKSPILSPKSFLKETPAIILPYIYSTSIGTGQVYYYRAIVRIYEKQCGMIP